jgi:transposase
MQEERQAAKARMIAGMRAGRSWREAAAKAGVQTSRTAAYRLLRGARARGEAALCDGGTDIRPKCAALYGSGWTPTVVARQTPRGEPCKRRSGSASASR